MKSISFWSIGRLWNLDGSWKSSIIGNTTTLGPVAPAGFPADVWPDWDGAAWAPAATNQQKHFYYLHLFSSFIIKMAIEFIKNFYLGRVLLCEILSLARELEQPTKILHF